MAALRDTVRQILEVVSRHVSVKTMRQLLDDLVCSVTGNRSVTETLKRLRDRSADV